MFFSSALRSGLGGLGGVWVEVSGRCLLRSVVYCFTYSRLIPMA